MSNQTLMHGLVSVNSVPLLAGCSRFAAFWFYRVIQCASPSGRRSGLVIMENIFVRVTNLQSRRQTHPSSLRGELHLHAPSTSIHHMQSQHNVTDAYSHNMIIETHQRSRR